jgi:hypothetical protein
MFEPGVGEVESSEALGVRNGSRRSGIAVAASVLAACAIVAAPAYGARSTASPTHQLVVYSVAVKEEFNDHSDDRARGDANNPFGNFLQSRSYTAESGAGPFAGDRAIFVFELYSDASLKDSIGSATFACQYGFAKKGICQVDYTLGGSSLIGMGGLDFDSQRFALAITGGTGKYVDASGDVQATPAAKHANRLSFVIT